MNTIITIIAAVVALLVAIVPALLKFLASMGLDINKKQFDLLRKIVEDAVSHVNQMALAEEMSSTQKKALAIEVATDLATKFGIDTKQFDAISGLIESVLWQEDDPSDEDDEDDEELI